MHFSETDLQDKELRKRLQDSEHKLGLSMPIDEANERAAQLESEVTSLERYFVKACNLNIYWLVKSLNNWHNHKIALNARDTV